MSKHHAKKYVTEALMPNPEGRKVKTTVYVLSCYPCQIYGQEFKSKSARDRAAEDHK